MWKINLSDESLFGNEAAEDEILDIFSSYAVQREEVDRFINAANRISIIRAYKGEGKSALLRLVSLRLQQQSEESIIIATTASAVSPDVDTVDSDRWVRGWKLNILRLVAREIGSRISMAFSDDAISLLEEAEANNYRERSFVSSIIDRLKSSAVPIERTRTEIRNPERVLQRWSQQGSPVWLIIDDVDQNFENTPLYKTKLSSFFTAIRQIVNLIPEIKFRTAIRPNVWAIIKREQEALSHVEQYIEDIRWTLDDYKDLIANRVEGYLRRTKKWEESAVPKQRYEKRAFLINQIFASPMPWGYNKTRAAESVLYTLSRHRPRWLIELCKEAAKSAYAQGKTIMTYDHISHNLENFSKRRVDDTVAEFRSQCPEIEELLTAFVGQAERFKTADLMSVISNRVLQSVSPQIIGTFGKPAPREVAQFLFQIGFLTARKDTSEDEYEHVSFAENPLLLNAVANLDQGFIWEIHPVFRQALKLKNVYIKKEK